MTDPIRNAAYRLAWRLHFTGRMMERLRCGFRTAWRRSDEALIMRPSAIWTHPKTVADERCKLYRKP